MSTTVIDHDRLTSADAARYAFDLIHDAVSGLDEPARTASRLHAEVAFTLFDAMTPQQVRQALIGVALQHVQDDPDFNVMATRLALAGLYESVLGSASPADARAMHAEQFAATICSAVADGLLDRRMGALFDLTRLAQHLRPERDELLTYIGLQTMVNRYMLTDAHGDRIEVPQFMWMRVAMGLSLTEANPTQAALEFYEAFSQLRYLPAGSTLVNAGTSFSQLSNCFVMQTEDEIEHIAKTIRDVMWITKGTGGIGLSVTKLRAEGAPIRSNNTASTGPIPFMHTIDSTLRAVSRGGKKFGALCFYMENWHLDFGQFLDLRQNSGDPYRRTRTANTAVWISDEFMKRVAANEQWYLFDPFDTPDLVELYGQDFSRRYQHYVDLARIGAIRHKVVGAREQFKHILMTLQATSHPWLTFKDTINTRALNDNTGTIHLSNLCTEITLPQDRDNTAVCNLASVNLSRHVTGRGHAAEIEWDSLASATRLAVRGLDNLIDITVSAVEESERSNELNRAIGLGVMGLTDVAERFGWSYDSPEACELIDRVTEFISWHAIDASCDLAAERGSYPNFNGSGWSKGLVPLDTVARLQADRGQAVDVDMTSWLDWDVLRERVQGGIRNATLMAVAPTASIGLVAGTTPGLDPQFSNMFSRTTSAGKFLEVNRNLVADLKELGLWEATRHEILRHHGDLHQVPGVPRHIADRYRTSFAIAPHAFLNVAARAQKWVDQAISRNMYLRERDIESMVDVYTSAWRMGVKSTYYLHMMPRHTAEASTVRVNKAEQVAPSARRGFSQVSQVVDACPVDPQERLDCEACQ
jgi:ribonucleoside-diphosphate reductase alpha chain